MKQDQLDKMANVVRKANYYKTEIKRLQKWIDHIEGGCDFVAGKREVRFPQPMEGIPEELRPYFVDGMKQLIADYETKLEESSYEQS